MSTMRRVAKGAATAYERKAVGGGGWQSAIAQLFEVVAEGRAGFTATEPSGRPPGFGSSGNLSHGVLALNAAISACGWGQQPSKAAELLRMTREPGGQLRRARLLPSKATFAAAVGALGRGRGWREALDVFALMRRSRFAPHAVAFNAAIGVCKSAQQWQQPLALLVEMNAAVVAPDAVSFNTSLSACERNSRWQESLQLLGEMRRSGIPQDTITYSAALSACTSGSAWEHGLQVFRAASQQSVFQDVVLLAALLHTCEKGSLWQVALDLHTRLVKGETGQAADRIAANTTLSVLAKSVQWERSIKTLENMTSAGIQSDTISLNSCAHACARAGRWRLLLALIQEPTASGGIEANFSTYKFGQNACEAAQFHRAAIEFACRASVRLQPSMTGELNDIAALLMGNAAADSPVILPELPNRASVEAAQWLLCRPASKRLRSLAERSAPSGHEGDSIHEDGLLSSILAVHSSLARQLMPPLSLKPREDAIEWFRKARTALAHDLAAESLLHKAEGQPIWLPLSKDPAAWSLPVWCTHDIAGLAWKDAE
eukprot:TRINITY_DN65128_c0_g1_i1.p1 TRINITY_DN65128_c0_g1~~TRINITY_DN65128_c0_g1_i1.p1  ORF type:complete len:545 (-),score=102.98 TRINITY_DN65128_c0_g1_i1:68-1702(-)